MAAYRVTCTSCQFPIPVEASPDWVERECPSCHFKQVSVVFPAIRGLAPAVKAAAPVVDGLAACFFHAAKPAVVPCGICGRFLCDLCDINIEKRHLCTLCLQAAQEEKSPVGAKPVEQVRERTYLPQNMALILAVYGPLSLMGLYVMFITAPAAVWISIRHWNHPGGIQRRGRWRLVVSLLAALIQIAGMIALAAVIWIGVRKGLDS